MILLPNTPTDNLYKFMSIAGLILIVSCSYVTLWLNNDLRSKAIEIMNESETVRIEIKYFEEDLKRQFGDVWKEVPISKTTPEQQQKLKEIEIRAARLDNNSKELDWVSKALIIYSVMGGIGVAFGGICAGFGFRWWRDRLQKYQDEVIRNQARNSGLER